MDLINDCRTWDSFELENKWALEFEPQDHKISEHHLEGPRLPSEYSNNQFGGQSITGSARLLKKKKDCKRQMRPYYKSSMSTYLKPIFLGMEFLKQHQETPEVLLAILRQEFSGKPEDVLLPRPCCARNNSVISVVHRYPPGLLLNSHGTMWCQPSKVGSCERHVL